MANNPQSSGAQPLWPPPSGMGSQNFAPMQYRPAFPTQQGQTFLPATSQQFRPAGLGISSTNVGMHGSQDQPPQFSHPMQQVPPNPVQPGYAPSSQAMPMSYVQTNRPPSSSLAPQQSAPPFGHPMPGLGAPGGPHATSYTFAPSSFGQQQNNVGTPHVQPIAQLHAPVAGQPWLPSGTQGASPVMPVQLAGHQGPVTSAPDTLSSDWQEHEGPNGRRYYYNKKTKQSVWEKPPELMTPIERADASTVWKEFTNSDGRKYYYNKVTKQSVWSMPEELKLARENALKSDVEGNMELGVGAQGSATSNTGNEPPAAANLVSSSTSAVSGVALSPAPVTPVHPVDITSHVGGPSTPASVPSSAAMLNDAGVQTSVVPAPATTVSGSANLSPAFGNANSSVNNFENVASQDVASTVDGASSQDIEEAKRGMAVAGKVNETPLEDKAPEDEPVVYSSKQEAKNAFKALLESVNVQSDWTWEQTMREIINDKRYSALKTLGERKQAFNEYLGQRRKVEAEERRVRQKKAREEFTKMLEECKELTSSVKWSKAVTMFENDDRFKAVERSRDREDLFENYMVELERKEKEKAAEEHRQHVSEYRKYLESCDFIKVNSQWRKVVDRLEDDERCLRLEKIDRLLIYQDYIRDLEKEEEDQKKIQKEQLRRSERKNRDAFRKLMEEHVTAGSLNAKTLWRDYCLKVKDTTEYRAVASNTSGSTPKDLFEDVIEELEQQYHEEKTRVKDAMKLGKISMASTWTFEDFKASIVESIDSSVSDVNLKLVYEELLERAKEKEEKEAKKRQRLADDFTDLLYTFKEITAASHWEECKPLFEDTHEYKSMGDDGFSKEIFEEYIVYLQEKAKEKERKREEEKARKEKEREEKEKRKDKDRKEKEREREKEKGKEKSRKDETDSETADVNDTNDYKDDKKKEKEKDRKHRKRHQSASDDVNSDRDEKESKRSRRHGSDRKKSRKHAHSPESDSESRHRRHRRDHRDSSRRNGGYEELEDGELGEDGEIQ